MGSVENGLLTIEGKLVKGVSMQVAEAALNECIAQLLHGGVTEEELQKAKNKTESVVAFEDMGLMSRANNLAFYQLLGNAGLMNTELNRYFELTRNDILTVARQIFRPGNCNTLRYFAAN
jgi:predicted Zn-dependent peptidase